ncbi:MAG: DUF3800 domain-containing protein [Anaerolineales bacterium]
MYLCYLDESGTPEDSGNTSHFILAGLSVPIWYWKDCDRQIETIKKRYALENSEIHIAWILRPYIEQTKINNFDSMDYKDRRSQVEQLRRAELLRLRRSRNPKLYKQIRKNYRKTENYIHLTYRERERFIKDVAKRISGWGFARLFAECVDKIYFDPTKNPRNIDEQCFEQIVSRFEQYLTIIGKGSNDPCLGLLIHDNNETIALKHTNLMRAFHKSGTLWTKIKHIIETPLFVDSQLTSMVQVADVCAYVLRRYLENNEDALFDLIFTRADRKDDIVVGIRHFTKPQCTCKICTAHRRALG